MNQNDAKVNLPGRRALIAGGAAATLGVLIAPGLRLVEVAAAGTDAGQARTASSAVRWGLLIDTTLCSSDCTACVAACNEENHLSGGTRATDSQWVRKVELKDLRSGRAASLPMMCQHCANPPCVDVCPTGASMKRADGIVLVDRHICIGCRYCMMACPFKARSFVHETVTDQNPEVPRGKGCVEGCTLCVQRVDRGLQPACADACPTKAITFGNLNDPQSEIVQKIQRRTTVGLRPELKLDAGVSYQGA